MNSRPPHINDLLNKLLNRLQSVLGDQLVGLYLFGSVVDGGFDEDVSDIDLLAAVTRDVDDVQLDALREMHHEFVTDHPRWDDRIEVAYLSTEALRTFKEQTSRIAIISPGEPLHFIQAGLDWLMNWYLVLEANAPLFGPPPHELIAPISQNEFIASVGENALAWRRWTDQLHEIKPRSYAILTMCRALYAHRVGEHVSKESAALWAQRELPEWADLIRNAVLWRRSESSPVDAGTGTAAETVRFLGNVSELLS